MKQITKKELRERYSSNPNILFVLGINPNIHNDDNETLDLNVVEEVVSCIDEEDKYNINYDNWMDDIQDLL